MLLGGGNRRLAPADNESNAESSGPRDVIILLVGEAEKGKILDESTDFPAELCSYRKYLPLDAGSTSNH